MEDVRQETAVLLVYDHDRTLARRHTGGEPQQHLFETPYSANLRAYIPLRQHMQLLQRSDDPKIILAAATFGASKRRIVGSWEALGVDEKSMLICAKYIKQKLAVIQGKNEHIALIIQEHYQRNPHIRITRVILVDDDPANVRCTSSFSTFIKNSVWCDDHRFDVPVEGILVPLPECVSQWRLGQEVTVELPESEWRFLRLLNTVEEKVGIKKISGESRFSVHHFSAKKLVAKPSLINPLTLSLDETAFAAQKSKPLRELSNLRSSGDAWENTSCDSVSDESGIENVVENERDLLFRSLP